MSVTKKQIKKIDDEIIVNKKIHYDYKACQDDDGEPIYLSNIKEIIKNVRAGKKTRIIYADSEEGRRIISEGKVDMKHIISFKYLKRAYEREQKM